ncbi:MAG TPA: hypothetical protein VFY20_14005 [Gemmatimonadales bacterium]|nr:hypothetical protein [Gemmatimonadales bacterium]
MHSLLFVTDLAYEARGRRYGDEDVWLSTQLRDAFTIALCHPLDAEALMTRFDLVLVRNSGPVLQYLEAYRSFRAAAAKLGTCLFNPLSGKADMLGKQYLVDLSDAGYPVIPTIDRREHLGRLPDADAYVVKPRLGADSIGLQVVPPERLAGMALDGMLVQPHVEFLYEVSFYFIDRAFQYALYAPVPEERWSLARYAPTDADLAFAQRFIDWNGLDHGIQRVDACRTREGELLLVELEDLNPYLSLDLLDPTTRHAFVARLRRSLLDLLAR